MSSQSYQVCKCLKVQAILQNMSLCKIFTKLVLKLWLFFFFFPNLWMYLESCRASTCKNCKYSVFQQVSHSGYSLICSFTIIMVSVSVLCYIPYISLAHTYLYFKKGVYCSRKHGGSLACLSQKYLPRFDHNKNNWGFHAEAGRSACAWA